MGLYPGGAYIWNNMFEGGFIIGGGGIDVGFYGIYVLNVHRKYKGAGKRRCSHHLQAREKLTITNNVTPDYKTNVEVRLR